jgi:hypothetical protein
MTQSDCSHDNAGPGEQPQDAQLFVLGAYLARKSLFYYLTRMAPTSPVPELATVIKMDNTLGIVFIGLVLSAM